MKNHIPVTIPLNNYVIAGDWYKSANQHTAILILHGYPSVKSSQVKFATQISKTTSLSVLTFDYSGLGESHFNIEQTTASQHLSDAISCYDWLASQGFGNIIAIGESYGSYLLAHLWQYRPVNNIILRVPAINPPEYFNYPRAKFNRQEQMDLRKDSVALANHPLIIQCQKYTGKALVVTHGQEEAIPQQTTNTYIQALRADVYMQKEFYHSLNDPKNPPELYNNYIKAIANWINKT